MKVKNWRATSGEVPIKGITTARPSNQRPETPLHSIPNECVVSCPLDLSIPIELVRPHLAPCDSTHLSAGLCTGERQTLASYALESDRNTLASYALESDPRLPLTPRLLTP